MSSALVLSSSVSVLSSSFSLLLVFGKDNLKVELKTVDH